MRGSPARRAASARARTPPTGRSRPSSAELAYSGMLGEALARDLPRRGEDRQSDREVEPGPLLPKPRGSEIDRDSPQRPFELRRGDSAPHALLRLRAGAIGETDDREGGNAALQVGLDLDATGVETDERMRDGAREHSTEARLPRRRQSVPEAKNCGCRPSRRRAHRRHRRRLRGRHTGPGQDEPSKRGHTHRGRASGSPGRRVVRDGPRCSTSSRSRRTGPPSRSIRRAARRSPAGSTGRCSSTSCCAASSDRN